MDNASIILLDVSQVDDFRWDYICTGRCSSALERMATTAALDEDFIQYSTIGCEKVSTVFVVPFASEIVSGTLVDGL